MKYKLELEFEAPKDFYDQPGCERYCPFADTTVRDYELGTTYTECNLHCPFYYTDFKLVEINNDK